MRFNTLRISSWKQFDEVDIQFHPKVTILTGANGSGKTTILHLLARHFGWDYRELSTPQKTKNSAKFKFVANSIRWLKKLFSEDNGAQAMEESIGQVSYSNGQTAELFVRESDQAIYMIEIRNQAYFEGLNILSHRSQFRYQQVPTISTQKRVGSATCSELINSVKNETLSDGNFRKKPINTHIKEVLLSWAVAGAGNEYIEPDQELKSLFDGFENVLKQLIPVTIGFERIAIRNYEIVLITKSGEFMLDAVSGGLAALIELGWLIYNVSYGKDEIVVLIDEVENHLHPSMQRTVIPSLLLAFPNVQFIISTHSPFVVSSVKDSNVYAFRYNDQNRVISEKLDLVGKARTAAEILDEVLGVSFTMPIWVESNLESIVKKYSEVPLSVESVDSMRKEFKESGMENLMPIALENLLKHDKVE